MLVTSNSRTPFLGLPEGNCDFLKGTTLFRYSPFYIMYKLIMICQRQQSIRLYYGVLLP